ncbi:MAG: AraC family transcriptional regulator [Croceivirga sp.]
MKPVFEPIHQNRKRTITAFVYNKENFETPWHVHPQHELNYIEKSSGTKFIGDIVGPYQSGELVLLRSNVPHCWKNHLKTNEGCKSLVVHWDRGIYNKIPELEPIFELLRTSSKGVIFNNIGLENVVSKIRKLPEIEGAHLYIALLEILIALSRHPFRTLSESSFFDNMPTEFGTRMAKIHDFVENHYNRKIYLKELGNLVNLSEQSFARFFAKIMGRSFFTFLNEYRVNMAARMLLDTDDSVARIGFACGFESPPHFFNKFKKAHGISPSKYRTKFRN